MERESQTEVARGAWGWGGEKGAERSRVHTYYPLAPEIRTTKGAALPPHPASKTLTN
jgi:hypothetical protein